jgi:hypothetical protein
MYRAVPKLASPRRQPCGSVFQQPIAICSLECCDQNTLNDGQGCYPHSSRCGLAGGGGRAGFPGDVYGLSLDAFTKHEPMIAGKLACVIARPQDQVVRLCDHDQFFITSSPGHTLTRCLWMVCRLICLRSASLHAAQRRRVDHGNPVTQQRGAVPDLRTGRATEVNFSIFFTFGRD